MLRSRRAVLLPGRFAQKDGFSLQTKPHGHGDVHTLLHTSGLLPKLEAEGRTHIVFFQDTNVLAFKAIPAALGVSVKMNLAMNSLTVPRAPGEAAGAICKLVKPGEAPLVINVEYNQLEPLLKASGLGGDTADASGSSPYPGNVNTLIFALKPYAAALSATGGSMPEFVNPKYEDVETTLTRLLTTSPSHRLLTPLPSHPLLTFSPSPPRPPPGTPTPRRPSSRSPRASSA